MWHVPSSIPLRASNVTRSASDLRRRREVQRTTPTVTESGSPMVGVVNRSELLTHLEVLSASFTSRTSAGTSTAPAVSTSIIGHPLRRGFMVSSLHSADALECSDT